MSSSSSSSSSSGVESCRIPMEEVIRATENFSPGRCIGSGGFGKVYTGKLSERWQSRTAAIKRLDRDSCQGGPEFRNEVEIISRFHHENIISFIGYCDEQSEMIIVYEFARNRSLDYHIRDPKKMRRLTWAQRLKICIEAARGLRYLHSGLGDYRVIHRDFKSANILLDGNLVAKICDFGLSKIGPRNQKDEQLDTQLHTKVAGTKFYIDPTYYESNILTKESDVYSFGIVLFEMLSGMLVYCTRKTVDDKQQLLMSFVRGHHRRHCEKDEDRLIDPDIRDHIDSRSLDTFKEIAYQCIDLDFMRRPTVDTIIQRIQKAWDIQENVDILTECVMEDMGFSHGKPLAAFTIYRHIIHYNFLEAERSSVLDRLIEIITVAIKDQNNNNEMAYWLSNASTLLFLIQKSLIFRGPSSVWKPSSRALLLKRISMGFHSSMSCVNGDLSEAEAALKVVHQVEAKYPALLFKQQLIAYVEKTYRVICDNLKKELEPILALCIEAPQTSEGVPRSRHSFRKDSQFSQWRESLLALCIKAPQTSEEVPDSEINHWKSIVDRLNTLLTSLKENFVPPIIIQNIFTQTFSYIDVHLFNSILSRPECCSFSNGEYVKAGLAELELWCCEAKEEYAGSAWDELRHIRQAVRLLTIHHKHKLSIVEITNELCPILSIQQLYRICTMSSNDTHSNRTVSQDVISSMRTEDPKGISSSSFLLEEDFSMASFVVDLSTSVQVKEFVNVKLDVEEARYQALQFLYEQRLEV